MERHVGTVELLTATNSPIEEADASRETPTFTFFVEGENRKLFSQDKRNMSRQLGKRYQPTNNNPLYMIKGVRVEFLEGDRFACYDHSERSILCPRPVVQELERRYGRVGIEPFQTARLEEEEPGSDECKGDDEHCHFRPGGPPQSPPVSPRVLQGSRTLGSTRMTQSQRQGSPPTEAPPASPRGSRTLGSTRMTRSQTRMLGSTEAPRVPLQPQEPVQGRIPVRRLGNRR